jgi:hypothetical protein
MAVEGGKKNLYSVCRILALLCPRSNKYRLESAALKFLMSLTKYLWKCSTKTLSRIKMLLKN